MSRWLSPEKAARRAERAAKDAGIRRKERRRTVLMISGLTVVSLGLVVADYFLLRSQAKHRHQQRYHSGVKTNAPASTVPLTRQSEATNHE